MSSVGLRAALGQSTPELDIGTHRPTAAGRVLRLFDFEERADPSRPDFNPEPVPRHWVRAQHSPPERDRPGFPLVNKGEYDTTTAHSGKVSVRLPTQGGSTSLRLSGTLLPVFPSVGYSVSAQVKTAGLVHARAFLAARLLNEKGEPIADAQARSQPVIGENWQEVHVELPGRQTQAAFVELELLLLQPEQFEPTPITGVHHVWKQDLSGAAWFDDVSVTQVPRVALGVSAPAGIAIGEAPRFSANIQDLTGEEMSARLTLRDIDDQEIAALDEPLGPGGGRVDWSPPFAAYGWYNATLEVLSRGVVIGSSSASVVYCPPTGSRVAMIDPRFGVIADRLEPAQRPLLAVALRGAGVGSVTVPVPEVNPGGPESVAALRETLGPLLASGTRVTLAIRRLDPELATSLQLDASDPASLFGADPAKWSAALRGLFDAFGQRVQRWSTGSEADPALSPPEDLAGRLGRVRSGLSRYVPGPLISLPWRAEWAWPDLGTGPRPAADVVSLSVPPGFSAQALAELGMSWKAQRGGAGISVNIEAPEEAFGRRGSVIEIAKRAALLWAALDPWNAPAETLLTIRDPWTAGDAEASPLHPQAALGCWRTLASHLGPRRVAGRLPAPPGVTCLVLLDARASVEGRRGGALLLWNDGSQSSEAELVQHLGAGAITSVDLFGNVEPMRPINAGGQYRLHAGMTPRFIEGVDAELALFIEGLRLDPPFIRAEAAEHEARIVLYNPWPMRVAGEVQLAPPTASIVRQSWRFTPTAPIPFALGPGERIAVPVSFSFSAAEESGPTDLTALVRFTAGAPYPPLVLGVPAVIGLEDLTLQASVVLSPTGSGPDVVATALIACTGTRARSLQIEALAPGFPTQQQPVSGLLPGESAIRRFVIKGAAGQLSGKRIRITLTDAEGTERLNRSAKVP